MPTMWSLELLLAASSSISPDKSEREGVKVSPRLCGDSVTACDVNRNGGTITLLEELIQQAAPLLSEQVGSGQTAVSADHAQVGDAALHEVVRGF